MKRLFIIAFLRHRVAVCVSLLLMVAATAALVFGVSIYHSAISTASATAARFRVLPMVNTTFRRASDMTMNEKWFSEEYPLREAYYQQALQTLAESPLLTRDDRRAYLGYAKGLCAMRSEPEISPYDQSTRFAPGSLSYEEPYYDAVLDVTLLSKEMINPGGNPFTADYQGGVTIASSDEEPLENMSLSIFGLPEEGFYPQYFYAFQINSIFAENSVMPIQAQKVYITMLSESVTPLNWEAGMRCLLYGEYEISSGFWYNELSQKVTQAAALQEENGAFYWIDLNKGVAFNPTDGTKTHLDRLVVLPHDTALDITDLASFAQSSALPQAEAERWYAIIQNCRETTESLYVVTTQDLKSVTPFNTDTMYIIEGRAITPADDRAVCVVSAELAKKQDVHIGDTISFRLWESKLELTDGVKFEPNGAQLWGLSAPADSARVFAEVAYEVVGIYHSMGWVDYDFQQYFSPNTVFVSACATPRSGYESTIAQSPQAMWGFYLKDPNEGEAFLASVPPQLRSSVQLLDQGYSYVKPLLSELVVNARTILWGTLALWAVVTGIFLFLHVLRARHTMGTLRSLGMPARKVFAVFMLCCMGLWLLSASLGGAVSALMYDDLEAKVYQDVLQSKVYNQAFSDLGSGADQGTNKWTGETDNTSAQISGRVLLPGANAGVALLALGAQGVLFFVVCAITVGGASRKKIGRLLRRG